MEIYLESKAVVVFEAKEFSQQICKAWTVWGIGIRVEDPTHIETCLVREINSTLENKYIVLWRKKQPNCIHFIGRCEGEMPLVA